MNDSKKARTIKPSTEKKLFALSKNQCYHPNCTNKLITNDKKDVLAKIAHIEAASSNGPRFNAYMTDDERRDFDNLILLCDEHHIEIDSHEEEFPTDLLKEWKLLHEGTDIDALFQHTLKIKYLNDFETISLLSNIPKSIDNIFVNLAIIKEKQEKQEEKDNEKLINREVILSSYEEIYKPKEPIEIKELVNTSNKSLIYGKAGIGKTTLCKYIAYMWAKGELYNEFEYLIYIPLREWKSDSGIKGAIRDYYYSLDIKEISIDFDANKTLFLFDGYDELDADKKTILGKEIKKYILPHYIITTRPYGYQKSDFGVEEVKYFETIGFIDEDVTKYIENFFEDDNEKSKKLKAYLQSNISIRHIGYIPLILEMICSLWKQKEFGLDMTMTELYSQVIEDLLSVYARKKGYETVYKKKYKSEIEIYLGSIAFQALKKQTIVINGTFLEKSLKKIKTDDADDFLEQSIFYTGFLKSDNSSEDPWKNNYQFPHLTFQEYFSALYVSGLKAKKQKKIIQEWKFYPHMQMFFIFLGGLIENKELLLDEIIGKKDGVVAHNESYIFMLVLDCLPNIKKDELSEEKIRIINENIVQELERTLHYPLLLKKLKLVYSFINDVTVNYFIDIINDDRYFPKFRKNLTMFLFSIDKYSESIINVFIEIIKDPDLEDELAFNRDKFIKELLIEGKNKEKNIDICFSIIKKDKGFHESILIIEELLKSYDDHKNKIMNLAIEWIITTEENENDIMSMIIAYEDNPQFYNEYTNFLSLLKDNDKFINFYIELLNKDITIERKNALATFLYFMNKHNSEVMEILIANPLRTFNTIVKSRFGLFDFIKEDIARGTNIFNTLIKDLEDKKINLSIENSYKIIDTLLSQITYGNSTPELDIFIVNFVTKYYIENKNIDYKYKKELVKTWFSRFNLIRESNKTVEKILKEVRPHYPLNNQSKNIKVKDTKILLDILEEKSVSSWDIQNVIKNRWNKNDFLLSIQNENIDLEHKKQIVEAVIESHVTQKELISLDTLMTDVNIDLVLRKYIVKTLYEKGFDTDMIFDTLIEFIKETDLKFRVKVNPEIKSNRNIEIVDATIEKLNRYYDKDNGVDWFFRNSGLSMFLDNEKVVDILFRMIRNLTISSHDKKSLLGSFDCNKLPSNKASNTLVGFIQDRGEDFVFTGYDERVIDKLLIPIKEINLISEYNIIKKLMQNKDIEKMSKWTLSALIARLAKSTSINASVLLEDVNISQNIKKIFTRSCSTEKLFEDYKTEYEDMTWYIIYHVRYMNLPFYITKENTMCVVNKGKKVVLKEINNKVLEEILRNDNEDS